jgi:hypothetical protein
MDPASKPRLTSTVLSLSGLAALSALLGGGCGDSSGTTSKGLTAASALVVLSSDYKSSTASLYDPATKTLVDDCVPPSTLSKDTGLPTGTQGGDVVVLDREHSLVDFVDPHACQLRAQISVSTGGFKSNPHDVVHLSATKAYVTRYEKNAAPTPAPDDFDEGDDLLIIDPSAPKVTGRIDMSSHATMAAGAAGVTLQARPDHAVLANGLVYVTLNNLAADFSAAGPGRVVVVDPATDTVTGTVDLPDQTGCSGLAYDDATKGLYVTCGGEFTDADQTAASALVEIDVSGATPALGKIVSGKSLGTQPVSYNAAAVLGGTAFVVTAGALDPKSNAQTAPDTLYAIALATGAPTKVLEGGAFNLGRPAVDAATKTLFLPDGDPVTPRVRVFDLSAAPVAGTPFEPNPAEHLPPREAARY